MFNRKAKEDKKVLATFTDTNLKVTYLWNKQGKLLNWNDQTDLPTTYPKAKICLERYTFSERVDLIHKRDYDVQVLSVNDQYLPGDVSSLEVTFDKYKKMTLHCKIIVGSN